uniref:Uncharacterized protein n=1 Tax=Timema bartmani TaxID=61472 RepID=A0A7R9ESN8_9NEOP|nr:unnamed protein product [Timema bartmani]
MEGEWKTPFITPDWDQTLIYLSPASIFVCRCYQRAKTQLQSMLLMNLEARPVVFEDIGRQVLATGHRKRPSYFIDAISKVKKDDIVRVAKKMLRSPPSVAARGGINKLQSWENIQAGLLHHEGKIPGNRGRLSLFR